MKYRYLFTPTPIKTGISRINRLILSGLAVLSLCLAAAPPVGAAAIAAPPAPGISERYARDPVFNSRTYIREAGKGNKRTIVLVHGIGEEASLLWHDLIGLLAERFHVIAFDLPGFGKSGQGNALYSPERYGEFLHWVIRENSTGPVILLGHSLGGALVLRYASTHPETVDHLLVVDAAGILHRISLSKNFVRFEEPESRRKGLAGLIQKPLEKPLHALNKFAGNTMENLEFAKTDLGLETIIGYPWLRKFLLGGNPQAIASLALVQEDFTTHLAANKVPTSIIWGRDDEVSPLRTAKLLAGRLPVSRLRIIERAGHVPLRDQPGEFNRVLLAEIEAPPTEAEGRPAVSGPIRTGSCEGRDDMVFSGRFDKIIINRCRRVLIKNVEAGFIGISRSEVVLEDTEIRGGEVGLDLERAKVVGTNVLIEAATAIRSSASRIDLAGAELAATGAALATPGETVALFSVSTVDSPGTKGNLHGVYRLEAGKGL